MKRPLRILCVHGLGDHRNSPWKNEWRVALNQVIPELEGLLVEYHFMTYDDIYQDIRLTPLETAAAAAKLLRSGVGSLQKKGAKGLFAISETLKWTAGMVVAWVEDEEFQEKTRKRVLAEIKTIRPDVLLAHSLGSLITYNILANQENCEELGLGLCQRLNYVSFGSQLANPFVVGNLSFGRVEPLTTRRWVHLYNIHDDVFTRPIHLPEAENFKQIETPFDIPGFMDHAGSEYLGHQATREELWAPIISEVLARGIKGKKDRKIQAPPYPKTKKTGRSKALLVGINEYQNPGQRLYGCVNDAFLMSALLQESGFAPEAIRLCLDHRATARGILDRLEWLLDDPGPDDRLVFYYSGHGAQLHTYGAGDEVDRRDESLVPYDFAWNPETSITDDQIYSLYSQLPYQTQFIMIFDCCHSGSIHRGSQPVAKGIDPPDDIRHRGLCWNLEKAMWEPRKLQALNRSFTRKKSQVKAWFGSDCATSRLGRATALRLADEKSYHDEKTRAGELPVGPYLPIILEACQEDQFAYEYRHGAHSYGAFTYALQSILRKHRSKGIVFTKLLRETAKTLQELGFAQDPQLLGPAARLKSEVPR